MVVVVGCEAASAQPMPSTLRLWGGQKLQLLGADGYWPAGHAFTHAVLLASDKKILWGDDNNDEHWTQVASLFMWPGGHNTHASS